MEPGPRVPRARCGCEGSPRSTMSTGARPERFPVTVMAVRAAGVRGALGAPCPLGPGPRAPRAAVMSVRGCWCEGSPRTALSPGIPPRHACALPASPPCPAAAGRGERARGGAARGAAMVARSSPPDTPARPCGACTAARSGPSRCWSWSWTAGERCRGVRGWPRCRTKGSAPPTPPPPGLAVGQCGRMGCGAPAGAGGTLLSLGIVPRLTPVVPGGCLWGLSPGSPSLSPGSRPWGHPRCPRDVSGSRRSGARSPCPGSGAAAGGGSACPVGAGG